MPEVWERSSQMFECYTNNLIVTRTVFKKGGIPQVQDTLQKQKTEEVKIPAFGMEDEYVGRIIKLVTDSEGDYEFLQ